MMDDEVKKIVKVVKVGATKGGFDVRSIFNHKL